MVVANGPHDGGELRHLRLGQPCRRLVHQDEARLAWRARARRRAGARRRAPARPRARPRSRRGRAARAARRRCAARVAGDAPTPSADTSTFSRTESDRNGWLCWNVRARPCLPRRLALQRVMSRPSSSTDPAVGRSKPRQQVDERRLAGAVRADQPDDLVAVELERDALHGLDAVERAREVGGPERSSGPPIVLRLLFRADPSRP